MPQRSELPEPFGRQPFAVRDALRRGVTRDRLRSSDLQKFFHGTRSVGLDQSSLVDRCRAYLPRMAPANAFSHVTAAELYAFPLPLGTLDAANLHVSAPSPARAPGGKGVCGYRAMLLADDIVRVAGLPVVSPAVAWCQLAESLGVEDAVAAGDWVVTGNPYLNRLPLAGLADLEEACAVRAGAAGHRTRVAALPLVREGPLSRTETFLRLLLDRAGLPAPLVNAQCYSDDGERLGMPDLAWPEYRVAGQYEGDHHRSRQQFRGDLRRDERFLDHDWKIVKVTADDLFDRPVEVAQRFARRLASQGWSGRIELRHLGHFDR